MGKVISNKAKCLSMFASAEELHSIDVLKSHYAIWEEWSGSRFVPRENPFMKMSSNERAQKGLYSGNPEPGSIIRSNPVTGYWEVPA